MPEPIFNVRVAANYDVASQEMFAPEVLDPAVEFLADLAAGGAALELGVGTGRVALPLNQRGVRVHGIDLSDPMLERLRAKPGAESIGLTQGDFATTTVPGKFRLVYIVFNAITNLTTQDEQVSCFRNAADHLVPGGFLVAEVFVPELQRIPRGDMYRAFDVTPGHLAFDEYRVVEQICISHHYYISGGRVEIFDSPHRYVWPSELDLMARLAGLSLRERWGDWKRSPFTATSTDHISVWQKPDEGTAR